MAHRVGTPSPPPSPKGRGILAGQPEHVARRDSWLVLGLVLLAFGIGCLAIQGSDLGLDGGLSLALGIITLQRALTFLAHDVHPPLYYVALRGWLALVGSHPFAVKYLSLICSTLTVTAFAAWARRFLGARAALRAGLLLAMSPVLADMTATVRDLAPGLLFIVVNCWAYCEIRRAPARRRWQVIFLASGILAIWTSFLAVGTFIGQGVDLIARREKGSLSIRSFLGRLALIGLSITPWAGFALANGWLTTLGSGGPTASAARTNLLADFESAVSFLVSGSGATSVWLLLAVLAVVAVTLGPAFPRRPALARFGVTAGGVTLLFALGVSSVWLKLGVPSRYLGPALACWILLVVGLAEAAGRWRARIGLGVLLAINLVSLISWYHRPGVPASFWDPSGVQTFIDRHDAPGDRVVFLTLEQAGYYAALSPNPRPWVAIPVGTGYLQRNASADASEVLTPLLRSPGTIWLVEYRGVLGTGQQAVDNWLARRAYPVAATSLRDSNVHPYLTGRSLGPARTLDVGLAQGVELTDAAFPVTAAPGEAIPLRLTWHAAHPLTRDLTVFVHLVGPDGQTVAQQDTRPVSGLDPTTQWQGTIVDRHGLRLPATLAPGAYSIEVGLYDKSGRLPVDGRQDGTIRLGPVEIRQ